MNCKAKATVYEHLLFLINFNEITKVKEIHFLGPGVIAVQWESQNEQKCGWFLYFEKNKWKINEAYRKTVFMEVCVDILSDDGVVYTRLSSLLSGDKAPIWNHLLRPANRLYKSSTVFNLTPEKSWAVFSPIPK